MSVAAPPPDDRTAEAVPDPPMANSNPPETGEFAAQLAALRDGPPTFRNLEILREEVM